MTTEQIRKELETLAEPGYRDFSSALMPGVEHVLGVRLPALRRLAKQLARENWQAALEMIGSGSFEETMLRGMVIGYAKPDGGEEARIAAFLPEIDNWAVCDSFCNGLTVAAREPERFWNLIQPYFTDSREYFVRFAAVMTLCHFLTGTHIDRALERLDRVRHRGYYAQMGTAWAISIAFIRFPEKTLRFLRNSTLDDFIFHKALRKITESRRVDAETKALIRSMKRKKG